MIASDILDVIEDAQDSGDDSEGFRALASAVANMLPDDQPDPDAEDTDADDESDPADPVSSEDSTGEEVPEDEDDTEKKAMTQAAFSSWLHSLDVK